MSDAEVIWEIDRWGDLTVEKIDETGSTFVRLGPVGDVLATLADFLRASEVAGATFRQEAK
jgi:hypothetical protein